MLFIPCIGVNNSPVLFVFFVLYNAIKVDSFSLGFCVVVFCAFSNFIICYYLI